MPDLSHWKKRLEAVVEASQDRSVDALFRDISDIAKALGREASEALLDAHPELFVYRPVLTEAYRRFVVAHDRAEARKILASDDINHRGYTDVASERSKALYTGRNAVLHHIDFGDCRRFVMVGCGRNPFTTFHVHDTTNVPDLIGLDIEPEAVDMANRIAAKLGYQRVRFELCKGDDFDYGGAQIVHVASMVTEKDAVISRIADTAPQNMQLILREPCGLGRLWALRAEETLDPRFRVIGRLRNSLGPTTDVYAVRQSV